MYLAELVKNQENHRVLNSSDHPQSPVASQQSANQTSKSSLPSPANLLILSLSSLNPGGCLYRVSPADPSLAGVTFIASVGCNLIAPVVVVVTVAKGTSEVTGIASLNDCTSDALLTTGLMSSSGTCTLGICGNFLLLPVVVLRDPVHDGGDRTVVALSFDVHASLLLDCTGDATLGSCNRI